VHIPKTGGGTVEKVLDRSIDDLRYEPKRRHATLARILEREPGLADYWIVGFVRNPWARMVSWWSMIDTSAKRAAAGSQSHIDKFERYPDWATMRGWDFDTVVTRGLDEVERLRITQCDFLTAGDRGADLVGRTETLAKDVHTMCARLGLPAGAKLPHVHRGDYGSYRDYYTPATRDRVGQVFAADIDTYGYQL
jgi:hypothetical protein